MKRKMEIIEEAEKRRVEKREELAKSLGLKSASTLCTILKNKDSIRQQFAASSNLERKRSQNPSEKDLEEAILTWLKEMRRRSVPLSGPIVQEKAREFAVKLGIENFLASNRWLELFKKRNGLAFKTVCGEAASVDEGVVEDWIREKLPRIIANYEPRNIFNADESALFFRMLPSKTLAEKSDPCIGDKKSKDRLSILICTNMDGSEKEKLVVIGKFARPRCLKNVSHLPVTYLSNKKAWMTSSIFESWIKKLDNKMFAEGRKIILFVDNCSAHPPIDRLRAILMEFFPKNTTSRLQPIDQGIVEQIKRGYRRQLVERWLISIGDDGSGPTPVFTILDAMNLVAHSWNSVCANTIRKCFEKAGFVDKSDEPQIRELEEEEHFPNIFDRMSRILGAEIDFDNYVSIDNSVQAHEDNIDDDEMLAGVSSNAALDIEISDDECESEEVPSHREAQDCAKKLRLYFLAHEKHTECLQPFDQTIRDIVFKIPKTQKKLTDFFKL